MNKKQHHKTAILMFSRSAQEEAKHKTFTLCKRCKKNRLIAEKLIQLSKKEAQKTNLPIFTSDETQQIGHSFGERLANELEFVFSKGYDSVLIIGNDCPKLEKKLLLHAKSKLNTQEIVLGPSVDGGVYLIGIQSDTYNREQFINLAWEHESLQDSWVDYGAPIAWLRSLRDIDDVTDLSFFLKTVTYCHHLRQLLLNILSNIQLFISNDKKISTNLHFNFSNLRAPPPLF